MSSIGTGYDLEAATFSPDGRIFQVEYAQKAIDNGGTVVAIAGKDGVVTAVDKHILSKLIVESGNPHISHVNDYIGYTGAGVYSDCQSLLEYAQGEAMEYLKDYKTPIPTKKLATAVAEYMHYFSLGMSRPYGCGAFLTSYDDDTPSIYLVEPSGLCYAYKAWAVGKHRQAAKTEIEKLDFGNMDTEQLVKEAVRILVTVRDESGHKNHCIEVSKVCNGQFEILKKEVVDGVEAEARRLLALQDQQ